MGNTRGFYLLPSMGLPFDYWGLGSDIPGIEISVPTLDLVACSVYLTDRRHRASLKTTPRQEQGRFGIWLGQGLRDDARMQQIADALFALVKILSGFGVETEPDQIPRAQWLPQSSLRNGVFVRRSEVCTDRSYPHNPYLPREWSGVVILSKDQVDTAWRMLPLAVQPLFFDAVRFCHATLQKYVFLGDEATEVVGNMAAAPTSGIEAARAEDAVTNAFKAVEAIIGEPPKDENKFKAKLTSVGIDPNARVGYVTKQPIYEKIRWIQEARDKRAAHGRTKANRTITYYEIMDFQECAVHVVLSAIHRTLQEHGRSQAVVIRRSPARFSL